MKVSKLFKLLKLIAINGVIFLCLLTLADLFLIQYYNGKPQSSKAQLNPRSRLEAYKNYDWTNVYWQEHAQFRNTYKSYIGWIGSEFNGESIQVSEQGLRKTAFNERNAKRSVAFLGGSTMWGYGVNNENTIPSYFSKQTDSLQVINMGQLAFCAFQSYLLLKTEIEKGNIPSIVITYDGANDSPSERKPYAHLWEERMKERLKGMDFGQEDESLTWLSGVKKLSQNLKSKWSSPSQVTRIESKKSFTHEENEQAARELLMAWRDMKLLCDKNGIEFYCVLQPQMHTGSPDLTYLENTIFKGFLEMGDNYIKYYSNVIQLIETPEFADLKPHFSDFRGVLDGQSSMYIDQCHVMPRGNEIIASALTKLIGK